jgi:hypothetical protein
LIVGRRIRWNLLKMGNGLMPFLLLDVAESNKLQSFRMTGIEPERTFQLVLGLLHFTPLQKIGSALHGQLCVLAQGHRYKQIAECRED